MKLRKKMTRLLSATAEAEIHFALLENVARKKDLMVVGNVTK